MKKLLTLLISMGLIASSTTTIVACSWGGGSQEGEIPSKPQNEYDSINELSIEEQSIYKATSNISKMLLTMRSENLGTRGSDKDVLNAGNLLQMFSNATTQSEGRYDSVIADQFSNWFNIFSSKVNEKNEISSESIMDFLNMDKVGFTLSKENNIFVIEDKFEKNNSLFNFIPDSSIVAKTLTTGPSFVTRGDGFSGYMGGGVEYANAFKETKFGKKTKDYSSNDYLNKLNIVSGLLESSANNLGENIFNFDVTKVDVLLQIIGALVPFYSMFGNEGQNSGKPNTLMDIHGATSEMFLLPKDGKIKDMAANDYGSFANSINVVFEMMIDNEKEIRNIIGTDTFDYLMGDNFTWSSSDEFALISPKTDEQLERYKKGFSASPKTTYMSSDNNGLFGKLINDVGHLTYMSKANIEAGAVTNIFSGEYPIGGFNASEIHGLDKKTLAPVFEDFFAISNVLLSYSDNPIISNLISNQISSYFENLNNYAQTGINLLGLDYQNFPVELFKFLNMFIRNWTNYEDDGIIIDPNITINQLSDKFGKSNFKYTLVDNLIEDIKLSDSTKDYNSKENEEYVNKVQEDFGLEIIDGNKVFREGSFFANVVADMQDESMKNLFKYSNIKPEFEELFLKNIIDPEIWDFNDFELTKDGEGNLQSATYTIEYKGIGDDMVASFKSNEEVMSMSNGEIATDLIIKNGKDDFINNYNGIKSIDELTKVNHKYTIKWINKGVDGAIDMYLDDMSNPMALINDKWTLIR